MSTRDLSKKLRGKGIQVASMTFDRSEGYCITLCEQSSNEIRRIDGNANPEEENFSDKQSVLEWIESLPSLK